MTTLFIFLFSSYLPRVLLMPIKSIQHPLTCDCCAKLTGLIPAPTDALWALDVKFITLGIPPGLIGAAKIILEDIDYTYIERNTLLYTLNLSEAFIQSDTFVNKPPVQMKYVMLTWRTYRLGQDFVERPPGG